jgi:hypothetical protein
MLGVNCNTRSHNRGVLGFLQGCCKIVVGVDTLCDIPYLFIIASAILGRVFPHTRSFLHKPISITGSISMKPYLLVSMIFIFTSNTSAQTSEDRYHFELSGTLGYSYSSISTSYIDPPIPIPFDQYDRVHIGSFQSSFGYFLSREWEFKLTLIEEFEVHHQSSFSIYFKSYNPLDYSVELSDNYHWTNKLGFSCSPVYNIPIASSGNIFIGGGIGLGWISSLGWYKPETWGKPEISFPVINVGARLFFSKDWAVILESTYKHTSNYTGIDGYTNSSVSVGVGLATYF